MPSLSRAARFLLCGLLITAAASCSSSKSATTASSGGSSPIKVGLICSCSGVPGFSQFAVPTEQSFQAWVQSTNASGGIAGHQVQLIYKDDTTNPSTSATDAQSLLSDGVVAIIDATTIDASWSKAAIAAKVPVVGGDSINATFDTSPDFYAEGQTNATTLDGIVAAAKAGGAKNIGILYAAEAPSAAAAAPLLKTAGAAAGIPEIYSAAISASAPNYTAQCIAAKQDGVTSLFIGDVASVADSVATDCARQGYNPIYVTEGAGFSMVQATSPAISKNLWTEYPDIPFWVNEPAVKAFNSAIDKYFPGVRENNSVFNEDGFMGWVSGVLLAGGLKAGDLTKNEAPSAAELAKGLAALRNDTLSGLAPPLTFTAGQVNHQNCFFVGHVQNGTPVLDNKGIAECVKS
jgi:branched-chain amino acid transport system substrate-binding protein